MGLKRMIKNAGEDGLHFARRVCYGSSGDVTFPTAEQLRDAQDFIDQAAKSAGPTLEQQRLVRRLAQGLPDTSALKSVSVVQPVVQDREAEAALRFRLSQQALL